MCVIYALVDPRTDHVRYIGHTMHNQRRRLSEHLWRQSRERDHAHGRWLKELHDAGVKPVVLILEEPRTMDNGGFTNKYALAAEKKWVAHFREAGAPLNLDKWGRAKRFVHDGNARCV